MSRRTNTHRTVVGVELEPTAVHVAAVDAHRDIVIRHAAVAPLEAGIVRDGEVTDVEGLADALRALWRDNADLDRRVRIGLANQKIVVRMIELPPIPDPKELEAAIRFRAQDEIPMPLDTAVLDYQALDVVTTDDGRRQRVLIVAARRDMIDRVLAAARAAGLKPQGIDLSAFAMVRALAGGVASTEQVLYLAIGGLTNLAVAQGTTCLFTRVIAGGLEAIAQELAERRGLTLQQARGRLTQVGLAGDIDALEGDPTIIEDAREVLLDGVRRIAADVRNSLEYHQGTVGEVRVERAVLTGPAARVPGFAETLAGELGLPVVVGVLSGSPAGLDAERLTIAAGLAVDVAPEVTS
jgi:type IV pilus assembly protein PilM